MFDEFYRHPPTFDRLQQAIIRLGERYTSLKHFPIGKSVLGRDIPALCIGNPDGAAVFVGATHGMEWLTTLLLFRFAERLLEGMDTGGSVSEIDVRKAMQNRSLVIIPCLNPDGVEISLRGKEGADRLGNQVQSICGGDFTHWQANANGVDLNHNFDAGWAELRALEQQNGIYGPAPSRYGGLYPGSEPETRAMTTFCLTCRPGTLYSFHSQGEEIYARYGEHTPTRSRLMAQILASSSGYTVADPPALAAHGGLKDWFIDQFNRPGFTIEIGRGENPLPVQQLPHIYDKLEEMLMIATLL